MKKETVVLAYSGGLDTSVLLKKFVLEGYDVVALTADLGESDATAGVDAAAALDAVRAKALTLGATDARVVDERQTFIDDYAQHALRANALYQGVYPLSAALSRPLIGKLDGAGVERLQVFPPLSRPDFCGDGRGPAAVLRREYARINGTRD